MVGRQKRSIYIIDISKNLLTSIFKLADATKVARKIQTLKRFKLADCVESFKIDVNKFFKTYLLDLLFKKML
jgi:hypothetical protein